MSAEVKDERGSLSHLTENERAAVERRRERSRVPDGTRFGKVVVLRRANQIGNAKYEIQCDCGTVKIVSGGELKVGNITSCGQFPCRKPLIKHGLSRNCPEYGVWARMTLRCYKPASPNYRNYGGRGINVCERWMEFKNFYEDMGKRPSPLHQIERINNDGNYEKSNCTWATKKEQANNRRTNALHEFNGVFKTRQQWAETIGIPADLIRGRLRLGWSVERALTEKVHSEYAHRT